MDDLFIIENHEGEIDAIKRELMNAFEMTNLEKLSYSLGFEFTRVKEGMVTTKEVCDGDVKEIQYA